MFTLRDLIDTGVYIQGDISVRVFNKEAELIEKYDVVNAEMLFKSDVSQKALDTEVKYIYYDKEDTEMLVIEVCDEVY